MLVTAAALLGGCAAPPPRPAEGPAPLPAGYAGRITLQGDPAKAARMAEERICIIPFGTEANAIKLEEQKGGVQFSVQLECCSEYGCIVEAGDIGRVVLAKPGIADAFALDLIEHGWKRRGLSAVSDTGRLAVPVTSPWNENEIWIMDTRFRLRRRIVHAIQTPLMLRWNGDDLYLIYMEGSGTKTVRMLESGGRMVAAAPTEPWLTDCTGGAATVYTTGMTGENPDNFAGNLTADLFMRGSEGKVRLELTSATRPAGPEGYAAPVKVAVDCLGRFNVVSALGEDIWCMRFGPDGIIQAMYKVTASVAGDARSLRIDRRGRFYFINTELEKDRPTRMVLYRVD